jgi:hypothetical protein
MTDSIQLFLEAINILNNELSCSMDKMIVLDREFSINIFEKHILNLKDLVHIISERFIKVPKKPLLSSEKEMEYITLIKCIEGINNLHLNAMERNCKHIIKSNQVILDERGAS